MLSFFDRLEGKQLLMSKTQFLLAFIFLSSAWVSNAQKLALFDRPDRMELVERGGFFIYNNEYDRADSAIAEVAKILPGHPIVSMMEALNLGWREMPIRTNSKLFPDYLKALNRVIESSEKLRELDDEHPEGVFFEQSARGLLAEHYAEEGSYIKALGEAKKVYGLMKLGFELVDQNPEFLFSVGIYNYFREMYPNRHPVYKPFMWFFRSGSVELGLEQMDRATRLGRLTRIEAHLYISYILLRYENRPEEAMVYLENLVTTYPNNSFFKAKYLEGLASQNQFDKMMKLVTTLERNNDPYFVLCGHTYRAYYLEKKDKNYKNAERYYLNALGVGSRYSNKGEYYKSLCYLGLGRVNEKYGKKEIAIYYYAKAIEMDENDAVTKEAKELSKRLK